MTQVVVIGRWCQARMRNRQREKQRRASRSQLGDGQRRRGRKRGLLVGFGVSAPEPEPKHCFRDLKDDMAICRVVGQRNLAGRVAKYARVQSARC